MEILRKGSEGIAVANWQRFLIAQGYDVEADGDFGERTAKATRAFQASQNLRADGIVGDNTFKAAEKAIKNNQSAKPSFIGSVKNNLSPMLDVNEKRLAKVHPTLAEKSRIILALADDEGYSLQVSQGLRTFAEQDALFNKRPKVTQARGGQSMHNYGLAVDFVFIVDGKPSWDEKLYRNIKGWAAIADLEWGGNWKNFVDLPHVQLKGLPSYKVLLPIYNAGGLSAVWKKYQ